MTVPFDIEAINFLSNMYSYQEGLDQKGPDGVNPYFGGCGGDQNKLPYAEMYHEMVVHAHLLKSLTNTIHKSLTETESMHLKILLYGVLFKFNGQSFRNYMQDVDNTVGNKVSKLFVNFLKKVDVIYILKKNALDLYDTDVLTHDILSPFIDNHANILNIIEELRMAKPSGNVKKTRVSLKKNNTCMNLIQNKVYNIHKLHLDDSFGQEELESAVEFYQNETTVSKDILTQAEDFTEKPFKCNSTQSLKPMFEVSIRNEVKEKELIMTPKKVAHSVKPTASSLLRFRSNINKWQEDEINWIDSLCKGSFDSAAIQSYAKELKSKVDKEEFIQIEKKHLDGLLTHEEMVIARENVLKKNKEKYERFLEEKKKWEEKIEEWKMKEYQRILSSVDHVHNIKENANKAKKSIVESKKNLVADLRQHKETLKTRLLEEKRKELEKKCVLIKEIKALHVVVKTLNKDKIFDFTETSNIGLFCEMSLTELKERLNILKLEMKQDLERRKSHIMQLKQQAKFKMETTKTIVEEFMRERKNMNALRKVCSDTKTVPNLVHLDKRIIALRNKLEERKALRRAIIESR